MAFTLKIDTANDAFQDGCLAAEVASMLREAVRRIDLGEEHGLLADVNGNVCGRFNLNERD